jgi:hypothetical protein
MEGLINPQTLVRYISDRQNENGGYTFARQAESNAQDTYYALEILRMLNVKPANANKTIEFLQSLQYQDGRFDSVKIAYYVISALSFLGAGTKKSIDQTSLHLEALIEGLENPHVYTEATSEIENVCFASKLLCLLNLPLDSERIIKHLLKMQNDSGSFGRKRFSRIASTFYALRILKLMGYDVRSLVNTSGWIRQCEVVGGGFLADPDLTSPFMIMEDTYFGVVSLETLGETLRHPQATIDLIMKFQNSNGGFRRSVFLGISEFESTYQALSCIESILKPFSLLTR